MGGTSSSGSSDASGTGALAEVVPSEATLSSTADRAILNALNQPKAWTFNPSNVQEAQLGFDSTFEGLKFLVVQYKSPVRYQGEALSIEVDNKQHGQLLRNFRPRDGPTAFFAFGDFKSYAELHNRHRNDEVLDHLYFVDAHSIPVGCGRLRLHLQASGPPQLNVKVGQTPIVKNLHYWTGRAWVNQLLCHCTGGLPLRECLLETRLEKHGIRKCAFFVTEMDDE